MELSFPTPELRDVCEKRNMAVAQLGHTAALDLGIRLADIEAATTFSELTALFEILDVSETQKSIQLKSGVRLVFESGHPKDPKENKPLCNWGNMTRIKIVAIEATNV